MSRQLDTNVIPNCYDKAWGNIIGFDNPTSSSFLRVKA